jgi:beta-N-acetylhexosaminidase
MTTEFPLPHDLEFVSRLSLPQLCGQLLVVGFEGTRLPDSVAEAIRAGLRGGVILFKRNLPDLETAWNLCREIAEAFPAETTPLIAIDQEGGRVVRMPPPFLTLPPMRTLGTVGDLDLTYRMGAEVGRQLAAVGITCNFAPVLDVDTNPDNPVVGDRSFSRDPRVVALQAMAFAHGLQDQGILACGKHFPGHGDTLLDSHLDLPTVMHPRERLEGTELLPFREAIRAGLLAVMTAHVTYPALDPSNAPATLSAPILTELLRERLRFEHVIFSDDLEMKGILKGASVPEAACSAVRAGCDALLVCHDEQRAEETLSALVTCAETDPTVSTAIYQANLRFQRLRKRFPPRAERTLESLRYCIPSNTASAMLAELETRLAALHQRADVPLELVVDDERSRDRFTSRTPSQTRLPLRPRGEPSK